MSRNEQVSEKLCAFCSPFWGGRSSPAADCLPSPSTGPVWWKTCRQEWRHGTSGDVRHLGAVLLRAGSLTGGGFKRPPLYFEFAFCPCSLFCSLVVLCCLNVSCLAVGQSLADPSLAFRPLNRFRRALLLPLCSPSVLLPQREPTRRSLANFILSTKNGTRSLAPRPAPHWL